MENDFKEYWAVRKNAGLFDHSDHTKLFVTGSDRITFLHNILTNDIKKLQAGEGCFACLLTATGKVLAAFNVYICSDSVLLLSEPGYGAKFLELLNKFIVTEDVAVKEVTYDYMLFSVQGPKAATLSQTLGVQVVSLIRKNMNIQTSIYHISAIVIREDLTSDPGFKFWVEKSQSKILKQAILDAGKNMGLVEAGFETEEILRIEAGILRYGLDYDENLTLPETGLDEIAASETKGCYPGQEVVARTKTYSGLQRKIIRLKISGDAIPKTGDKLYLEGKECGKITSACFSVSLGTVLAFGLIPKDFFNSISHNNYSLF